MKNICSKIVTTAVGSVVVSFAIALEATKAEAISLAINNAGFEAITVTDGNFAPGQVPGWELYDPAGLIASGQSAYATFNPPTVAYPNEAPEGNNIAALFLTQQPGSGVAGISQILQEAIAPGITYTLQVEVGNNSPRSDFPILAGFPGYAVQLLADGQVIAQDNNTLSPGEGTFVTSTVSYTAAANDVNLGKQLEIRLVNLLQNPGVEVNFDNVRLEATQVPEPTSLLGLLGLGAFGATSALKKKLASSQKADV